MATTIQMQGVPVVIPQVQQPPTNLTSMKSLAITQLVIGVLTVVFGIAVIGSLYSNTWTTNTAGGIWAGGWIAITGIIGVCFTRNYSNGSLNGVYMAFSIISTFISGLAGLFFIVAVVFYAVTSSCYANSWGINYTNRFVPTRMDCNYREVGLGLHIPLLILMIVEFFVSIIAAVFCCQNGCGRISTGVIIQPPQQHISVVTTAGAYQGGVQYPGQMAPQYQVQMAPQYGGQMLPQYGGQMAPQYGGQMAPPYVQQNVNQQHYPVQTNAVYAEKPPVYNAAPN